MIHGFLIKAHRDGSVLEHLIAQLLRVRDCRIYINIDRRSADLVRRVRLFVAEKSEERIHVRSDIPVRWGSFHHLDAFMVLAQKALQDGCDFFHTMTGQCRIVRPIPEIEEYFLERRRSNLLEHFPLPTEVWPGGGLDPGTQYFGGSTYYSIGRTAMEYLLVEYLKQRKRYRHTLCSEEVAPNTILCNAPVGIRDSLVNNNLRFVLWGRKHGESPGILDLEDRDEISASDCHFARKFDSVMSSTLARSFDGESASVQ